MLTETETISIHSNGQCNLCNSKNDFHHIYKKPDPEMLQSKIEVIRDKGKKSVYDCIVGWSGGRDSTSLLYELVLTHKLRCVAIFFKTPFTPFEIIENVRSISQKLGVKLIERETPDNHLKISAFCTKTYVKTKKPIMVNLACSPCKYLNSEIFKHAKKMKINYIIYGGNQYEYIPSSPAEIKIKSKNRFSIFSMLQDNAIRVRKGMGILISTPQLLRYVGVFFRASVLFVNPYTIYFRLKYSKISLFDYYFFADWDEDRVNFILQELNWKLPSGCTSTWRADCAFEAVKNTVFKKEVGFTYADAMYSNLIRSDKISRAEALSRIENEPVSDKRLNEVLEMFGIAEKDFISKSKVES